MGLQQGWLELRRLHLGSEHVIGGDWTQVQVSFASQGAGSTGRFAIVYTGPADLANYVGVDTFTVAVPEPETWALMLAGLAGLGVMKRRRAARALIIPLRSSATSGRAPELPNRRNDMFEFMKPLRAGAIGLGAVAVALGASMSASAQSSPGCDATLPRLSEAPPPTRRSSSRTATPASCAPRRPRKRSALHAGGPMPALAGAALRWSRARTGAALAVPPDRRIHERSRWSSSAPMARCVELVRGRCRDDGARSSPPRPSPSPPPCRRSDFMTIQRFLSSVGVAVLAGVTSRHRLRRSRSRAATPQASASTTRRRWRPVGGNTGHDARRAALQRLPLRRQHLGSGDPEPGDDHRQRRLGSADMHGDDARCSAAPAPGTSGTTFRAVFPARGIRQALANKLAGVNLTDGHSRRRLAASATSTSRRSSTSTSATPGCLDDTPFYLGLDGNAGSQDQFRRRRCCTSSATGWASLS